MNAKESLQHSRVVASEGQEKNLADKSRDLSVNSLVNNATLGNQSGPVSSLMSAFQSSLRMQPQVLTQATAPADPIAQLAQAANLPLASALMQQLLCSTLNAPAMPPQPANSSSLLTQLMTQMLATQLVQSSSSSMAGILQLFQAFSAASNLNPPVTPPSSISAHTVMSQLPSLDAATAKEVVTVLVKRLILSGDITNDDLSRKFLERLCFSSGKDLCLSAQASSGTQSPKTTPVRIKEEIMSLDDRMFGSIHNSESSNTSSKKSDLSSSAALQSQNTKTNCKFSDSEIGAETETEVPHRLRRSSGRQQSKKSNKKVKNIDETSAEVGLEGPVRNNEPADTNESSFSFSKEFHASGKRLRSRSKAVSYNEADSDGLDDSDHDADYERPFKRLNSVHSTRKSTPFKETTEDKDKSPKETPLTKSDKEKPKVNLQRKIGPASFKKMLSEKKDGGSSRGRPQKDCENAARTPTISNVKMEVAAEISILPNVNCCSIPEVRFLFMGRKNEAMEWLNLVAYKPEGASKPVNQCLFCPMTSGEVKDVADHIVSEHTDLGFVMSNLKQPNGRITFLACRHCNYVTFELVLMWIHFEMYHNVPGIMDGSDLPAVKVDAPTNLKTISIDNAVNVKDSRIAYICLDCMLCSADGHKVALHVLDSHPDTTNFNGCFVKTMMVRTKEDDSFTYRQALFEKKYSRTLKDAYFCMLCDYTTSSAYLAMSHSLRMHQKKRLLFVCSECEYQCFQESLLLAHLSECHQLTAVVSCMCSTTLVTGSEDGCYSETEIPNNRKNLDTVEKAKKNSANFIQSTTVSSSQKKHKFFKVNEDDDAAADENNRSAVSDVMPNLEPELKVEDSNAEHCNSEAPKLTPVRR